MMIYRPKTQNWPATRAHRREGGRRTPVVACRGGARGGPGCLTWRVACLMRRSKSSLLVSATAASISAMDIPRKSAALEPCSGSERGWAVRTGPGGASGRVTSTRGEGNENTRRIGARDPPWRTRPRSERQRAGPEGRRTSQRPFLLVTPRSRNGEEEARARRRAAKRRGERTHRPGIRGVRRSLVRLRSHSGEVSTPRTLYCPPLRPDGTHSHTLHGGSVSPSNYLPAAGEITPTMGYALAPGGVPAAGTMTEKERSTTQAAAADSEVTTQQEVSPPPRRRQGRAFPSRWLSRGAGREAPRPAPGRPVRATARLIYADKARSPIAMGSPRRSRGIGPPRWFPNCSLRSAGGAAAARDQDSVLTELR